MEFDYREELTDYLPIFMEAFEEQLRKDKIRWGDTWKHRPREGQEVRLYGDIEDYYDRYEFGNMRIPYLKIIGNAFICWVRDYEKEQQEKAEDIYYEEIEED